MDDYQVLTLCTTYNQSKYIEDALNGFVMQKTNFPFVCVIIDDASTDGEQSVIKTFLEREFDFSKDDCKETDDAQVIVAKHKTNTNCTFAVYLLKENHYSIKRSKEPYINPWKKKCKYVAFCEGDDYWIDPLKLQKQVDVMESDKRISMCHTGFNTVDEYNQPLTLDYLQCKYDNALMKGNIDEDLLGYYKNSIERLPIYERYNRIGQDGEIFWRLITQENYIMTLTVIVRIDVFNNIKPGYFDIGIFLVGARLGLVKYISEVTSHYRFHPNSVMTTPKLFKQCVLDRGALNLWGELSKVYDRNTYCEVMQFKGAKQIIVRRIFGFVMSNPDLRKQNILFMLKHPSLWIPMLEYCFNRTEKFGDIYNKITKEGYSNGTK